MFGLKGRDTFNKSTSKLGQVSKFVHKWWIKLFPYTLTVLILGIVGIISNTWYTYLYDMEVKDAEKKQYIDKKNQEVTFKRERFDEMRGEVILRGERFNEERVKHNDIFYIDIINEDEEE